jgi:aldehyde:ferredoxin oxidoreductase
MNYEKTKLERGYTNQLLTIDLGNGRIEASALDPEVRDYFLGGRALGLYLLHQAVTSGTGPSDPENPLIFAPGPLAGIPQFPGTSKCMAIALSPLTGIAGVSNFGGHFGAYLKYAGFDALTLTGKADREVMILIDAFRGEVTVTETPAIARVFAREQAIVEHFTAQGRDRKEIVFLTTGIGAERTAYGCINSHYFDPAKPVEGGKGLFRTKQAGRTGLGTVMKDKNIGAVVVLASYPRGENPYGAADWEKVKQAGAKLGEVVRVNDPELLKMYRKGSAGLISFMNKPEYKSLPVKNYQFGCDPEADRICGKFYANHLFDHRGMDGCFPGCNLRCTKGGWVTLTTGAEQGRRVWVDGPEYETAAGFGSNLGVWDPEFIMEANWHCDDYGIDTITVSVIAAFLMECFQRGYLTREQTDGLALAWGDGPGVLRFIHELAAGTKAFTRVAGRGMLALVDWICEMHRREGKADPRAELMRFAMQTKGLPFSLYRTHRSLSMQGSYAAASDIGAHHAAAWLIKIDLLGAFPTLEQKAQALILYPRVRLGNDNLGLCKLPWVDVFNPESARRKGQEDIYINPASQELYADFFNGMLGTDLTWQEIFARTDRDINLQRVMNVMAYGRDTARQDRIPERAIGPTEDRLYEAEQAENDAELARRLEKPPEEIQAMATAVKREALMEGRRKELGELVQTYYRARGWSSEGIPTPETLKGLGLWDFLTPRARASITELTA